jgi:hypothetical protein
MASIMTIRWITTTVCRLELVMGAEIRMLLAKLYSIFGGHISWVVFIINAADFREALNRVRQYVIGVRTSSLRRPFKEWAAHLQAQVTPRAVLNVDSPLLDVLLREDDPTVVRDGVSSLTYRGPKAKTPIPNRKGQT